MAEAAVTFLLENLGKILSQEADLITGIKDEVKSLQDELRLTQAYLRSFKPKRNEQPIITEFLNQVRAVAREAEDIIDEYVSLVAAQQRAESLWVRTKSKLSQLLEQRRVANDIKTIRARLEEIYKNRERYGIQQSQIGDVSMEDDMSMRRKRRLVEETDVVGFDTHAKMIIERLTKGEVRRDVVPIVGMGGIGKTTLAWKVYNDPVVAEHFRFRAWVNVFPGYRVRDLLVTIMKRAMGLTTESLKDTSDDELALDLRKYLRSTPYLIVLDDVWVTELWEELDEVFSKNMYGSRIILTTRHDEVAQHVNPSYPGLKLEFLSKEDSWKLFCGKVFPGGTCPSELEVLGQQIVDKCGGLPLATVVLAGVLLKKEKTPNWWSQVSSSVSSFLTQGTDRCSKILALSYSNLPNYLSPCFLYFSLFPKHMEIPAKQLVRLWIAEGFVHENNRQTVEEVGEDYLEELVARNLIQVSKRRFDGTIKSCSIHDLLQDLCVLKAKEEKFLELLETKSSSLPSDPHRLSFHSNMLKWIFSNPSNSKVRSILCFDLDERKISVKDWKLLQKHFPLLRVLDLWDVGVEFIPKQIDSLIHLRYLRLKSLTAQNLPASVCKLWKLQTLEVTAPCIDRPLIDIWKMQELRHLYFHGQIAIPEPPREKGKDSSSKFALKNLLTLDSISPDSCKGSVISLLPNLLKLGINGDLAKHMNQAFEHLSELVNLRSLKIERDRRCNELTCLPDAAKFPCNITKLTLSETQLLEDPMDILGELPNLQLLKLKNAAYSGRDLACTGKGFPKLQVLKLVNLAVRSWTVSGSSMLCLRSVVIRRCGNLEGLPSALQSMPCFQVLELWSPHASVVKEARKLEMSKGKERFKVVIYQS